jgi:hypothetical protein
MRSEWRDIAIVDLARGEHLVPMVCQAEPVDYRCRKLPGAPTAFDRWELSVNFADGEGSGTVAARALLRSLQDLADSARLPLVFVRGHEWLDAGLRGRRAADAAALAEAFRG